MIRLEDVGAGGISTTGWPGHLSCRVGVSVSVGRKGHGSTGLVLEFRLVRGVREAGGEGEFGMNESPVGESSWSVGRSYPEDKLQ